MSISPPSDIVMDVVNAVNPVKYSVAVRRLEKLGQATKLDAVPFSKLLPEMETNRAATLKDVVIADKKITKSNNDLLALAHSAANGAANTATKSAAGSKLENVHKKLEGVFLQGLINSMLSAQEGTMFGKGISGSYWKSFMARAIAEQVSKGTGIGIAASFSSKQHSYLTQQTTKSVVDVNSDYKHYFQKIFIDETKTTTAS